MTISQDALKESTSIWQCLGPVSRGGTVFGLAFSPVSDLPRIWAATGCGIFYSDDRSASWKQNLAGLTTPLLSAITVAPTGALFAGALGGGLFYSFDFGRTWEAGHVPDDLRSTITAMLASPSFRRDGTVFAATDGSGVLASRASGKTWEDSSFGLGDPTVLALACSPDWEHQEIMVAANLEGVYISRNGGRAWRETELILDDDVVDVLAFSPAFAQDHTILAGTEAGALYASHDGGRAWDLVQRQIGNGPLSCLWVDPDYAENGRIVAGVGNQVLISEDGGENWRLAAELPGSLLALQGDGSLLLAGMHDAGVWCSQDGGETWAPALDGLAARGFSRLVESQDKLYAIGPQEGLWVSQDWATWQLVSPLAESQPVTGLNAASSGLFVVSQQQGILRSTDAGVHWEKVCDAANLQTVLVLPQGKGWAGGAEGLLYATEDGGATWSQVASPCEGQEILGLAASPTFEQDHTLLMGTSLGGNLTRDTRVVLWRSTNAGETWRQLTTQVTDARWIDIAMPAEATQDPTAQAVVATGSYCLRPLRRAKDVWISTQVDPNGANILSVVAQGEVDQGGVLYAATGAGIYRSIDGGRTWQPFSAGLKAYSFISLMLSSSGGEPALYALSLGGLLWKRDLG